MDTRHVYSASQQDRLVNLRDCGLTELALLIGLGMWMAVSMGTGDQLTDKFLWRVQLKTASVTVSIMLCVITVVSIVSCTVLQPYACFRLKAATQ